MESDHIIYKGEVYSKGKTNQLFLPRLHTPYSRFRSASQHFCGVSAVRVCDTDYKRALHAVPANRNAYEEGIGGCELPQAALLGILR
jgi:hypothetical protein